MDTHLGCSCTVDTEELIKGVVIPIDEVVTAMDPEIPVEIV